MNTSMIHPGYQDPSRHTERRCRNCFHLSAAVDAPDGQCFGTTVSVEACCDLFTSKAAVAGFVPVVVKQPAERDVKEA